MLLKSPQRYAGTVIVGASLLMLAGWSPGIAALDREEALKVLQNSSYFPRYRVIELPIGNNVNIQMLVVGASGHDKNMADEFNAGYACASKLGFLSIRRKGMVNDVAVTPAGQANGWAVSKSAYGYHKLYQLPVYEQNAVRVTGIKSIDASNAHVEFVYAATEILDAGRCMWPTIDSQKGQMENKAQAKLGQYDDGWRVESAQAQGQYRDWVALDPAPPRLSPRQVSGSGTPAGGAGVTPAGAAVTAPASAGSETPPIVGEWTGSMGGGLMSGNVSLSLRGGTVGEVVGSIDYSGSYPYCSTELRLVDDAAGQYRFEETIVSRNPKAMCPGGGILRMMLKDASAADLQWSTAKKPDSVRYKGSVQRR